MDWYEAYADLAGERTKLQGFSMRSMASGAAFHCAFLHATQQAFLEGHERAFAYFRGVFHRLRYDNLARRRKEDSARASGEKRRHGSSRSGPTGALKASSARPAKGTRKAAWRERLVTFAGITGCRCPRPSILQS